MTRLKILSLFVAIQALSFGVWSIVGTSQASPLEAAEIHPASTIVSVQELPSGEPVNMPDFSSRNMEAEKRFLNAIKQNQILTVLSKLPKEHVESVENIILDYNKTAHRGLGGNSMIILRAVNMSTEELMSVLIHEMAHNVDYAALVQEEKKIQSAFKDGNMPLYETDPSLDFYRISWKNNTKLRKEADNMDFVSGYAMTDPFEDFAETYLYYVLHNKDFKVLSGYSSALYAKYQFMKYQVFEGREFDTGSAENNPKKRPWDITVLKSDLTEFLS